MDANQLLSRIIASGADETGIHDRFGDNVDLYESCFFDFMQEPSFVALRDAIHTRSYEQAFATAHALKGLSGNLGLSDFYAAIRSLTNSLRDGQYDNLAEEYAAVERQHERLQRLVLQQPLPEVEVVAAAAPDAERGNVHISRIRSLMKDKSGRLLLHLLFATVLVLVAIGLLFGRINQVHNRNVLAESGQHLTEISTQIKLYIEDNIATDWKIAYSVGNSIRHSSFVDNDAAIFNMLQNERAVWDVSDLMLYTENGYCIYADGSAETTDVASATVYHAREQGKWLSILDSRLIYTVPLDTELTFKGAKIVAVSVVRDMSSFLDEMDFSSFGGAAWLYLTDQGGVVVSSLTTPAAMQAFNMQSIVRETEITPLDAAGSAEDFLLCPQTQVFALSDAKGKNYGVSTPVMTDAEPMRLFYFVPQNVVNSIMSGFSQQLTVFSMGVIALFAIGSFVAFLVVYKSRKKMFDQAILTREKMFDLLVKNTKTAFGLFSSNQPQPEYISANAAEVMGDSYWALTKTEVGFQVHNDNNIETENISLVNRALQDWDGKRTFRSGYLCNRQSATPTYFVFELYPVDVGASDFVGVAQDVTSTHAREEAVKSAMESAKQANEAKTRFLSSMSHDIRTPMNAIMSMSSFALESIDQPKKLGNHLRVIHESAEHLLHLINDILDMSRIESGQLVIASTPFELKKEMQRQVEIISPLCRAKQQTLITDFSGLKQTMVVGDALKLSQIVINLLSNAVKFTPEKGAVRFIVKQLPVKQPHTLTLGFSVEDNGIGIAPADIKHIFEPFNRANDKAVSKIEGTGLGLAIVKNYVDALGGAIRCDSELGEGSMFSVELSFPKADMPAEQVEPPAALTNASFLGMHALVAEDNPTNQMIAKETLERMGFILDFVDDGSAAVEKFRASKPYAYDVIFMDIQMPVMDGITATEQIRAAEHAQAKTIPIVAMTANAFAEDIEKARAAGMDGYVAKPISSSILAEETKKAIESKRGEEK